MHSDSWLPPESSEDAANRAAQATASATLAMGPAATLAASPAATLAASPAATLAVGPAADSASGPTSASFWIDDALGEPEQRVRDELCAVIGELSSGWSSHTDTLRRQHDHVALVVQWPSETYDAFSRRAVAQLNKKKGPTTIVLATSDRMDKAAVQARNRILRAVLEAPTQNLELMLLVPPARGHTLPAWAISLADRLRNTKPGLNITIRLDESPRVA